jgi:hypothetical protein
LKQTLKFHAASKANFARMTSGIALGTQRG